MVLHLFICFFFPEGHQETSSSPREICIRCSAGLFQSISEIPNKATQPFSSEGKSRSLEGGVDIPEGFSSSTDFRTSCLIPKTRDEWKLRA